MFSACACVGGVVGDNDRPECRSNAGWHGMAVERTSIYLNGVCKWKK